MDYEHMSNMIIEVVVKLSPEYPVGDVEAGSTDTLELLPQACCTLDLQKNTYNKRLLLQVKMLELKNDGLKSELTRAKLAVNLQLAFLLECV